MEHSGFYNLDPFFIPGVTSDIVELVQQIVIMISVMALLVQKLRSDCRNRRFPIPLRSTGKLEYAMVWLLFAFLRVLVLQEALGSWVHNVRALRHTPYFLMGGADQVILNEVSHTYVEFAVAWGVVIVFNLLAAYEAVIAITHAIAAARYGPLYLLEMTAAKAEANRLVA